MSLAVEINPGQLIEESITLKFSSNIIWLITVSEVTPSA
jgi:hypothetical protein